jgi:hypothetical protein
MIEVGMRIYDVPDRLVRDQLLRFRDNGIRSSLALGTFDNHNVVLEVDGDGRIPAED